jgi:hypothetical protein
MADTEEQNKAIENPEDVILSIFYLGIEFILNGFYYKI